MRGGKLAVLSLLLGACGAPESVVAPSEETGRVVAMPERVQAAFSLYERTTGQSTKTVQDVHVVPESALFADGRCDAYWEGTKLHVNVLLSQEAVDTWSTARLNLLVAHELEHCVRGVGHTQETGHLMNPAGLTEKEATARSYESYVEQSLKDSKAADPTKL